MDPENDRRSAARTPFDIWIEETSDQATYFQRSANLSAGGLYVENGVPQPVGTQMALRFSLPDDATPIRVTAEVVRVEKETPFGMHLKFLQIPDDAAHRIARYVEQQRG
ncbi:MAG: PilZ domain-containing protein [Polyangia bacterium]